MQPYPEVKLLGLKLTNLNWEELLKACQASLNSQTPLKIFTLNGEIALQARKNSDLFTALNAGDFVIADSTNIYWLTALKGRPLQQRLPGADLVTKLLELAAQTGNSVFLLGSKEGIAAKAAENLTKRLPQLKIAGTSSANPDQIDGSTIKKSGADIVFVAYGAPKQEIWVNDNAKTSGAKILVGIGGVLDMLSGTLPRAPRLMRTLSLEWLWRLFIQPSRIGRIWRAVVVFPLTALFG